MERPTVVEFLLSKLDKISCERLS